jgi:hypothetical protein
MNGHRWRNRKKIVTGVEGGQCSLRHEPRTCPVVQHDLPQKCPSLRRGTIIPLSWARALLALWSPRKMALLQGSLSGRRYRKEKTTMKSACCRCGEIFVSVTSFDAHRVGSFELRARRCLTPHELGTKGMMRNEKGWWMQVQMNVSPWYDQQYHTVPICASEYSCLRQESKRGMLGLFSSNVPRPGKQVQCQQGTEFGTERQPGSCGDKANLNASNLKLRGGYQTKLDPHPNLWRP